MADRDKVIRDDFMECLKEFAPSGTERSLIRGFVLRSLWVARGFDELYYQITNRRPSTSQMDALRALDDMAHRTLKVQDVRDWKEGRKVNEDVQTLIDQTVAYIKCGKTPEQFKKEFDAMKQKYEDRLKTQADTLRAGQNKPLEELQKSVSDQNGSLARVLEISRSVSQFSIMWVKLIEVTNDYKKQTKDLLELCQNMRDALSNPPVNVTLVERIEKALQANATGASVDSGTLDALQKQIEESSDKLRSTEDQLKQSQIQIDQHKSFLTQLVRPFVEGLKPIVTSVGAGYQPPDTTKFIEVYNASANFGSPSVELTSPIQDFKDLALKLPMFVTAQSKFLPIFQKFREPVTVENLHTQRLECVQTYRQLQSVENNGYFSLVTALCTQSLTVDKFLTSMKSVIQLNPILGNVIVNENTQTQGLPLILVQSRAPFFLPVVPQQCALLCSCLIESTLQNCISHAMLQATLSFRTGRSNPNPLHESWQNDLVFHTVPNTNQIKAQFLLLTVMYLLRIATTQSLFNFVTTAKTPPIAAAANAIPWFLSRLNQIAAVDITDDTLQPGELDPVPDICKKIMEALNISVSQ